MDPGHGGALPQHVLLVAAAVGTAAAVAVGVLPGGSAVSAIWRHDSPVGANAPYLAVAGLPAARLHEPCERVGDRAAYFTQLVTCSQSATDGLGTATWEFADPYLRLPRAVVRTPCDREGAFARDFARPTVHRCTADAQGTLTWEPDAGWTRDAA